MMQYLTPGGRSFPTGVQLFNFIVFKYILYIVLIFFLI